MPRQDAAYDCTPADAARSPRRTITVGPGNAGTVVLVIGGRAHPLLPVAGGGPLFASPRYAWRMDGVNGVLTEVETAELFRCRLLGPATAAAPGPQAGALVRAGR